MSAGKLVPNFEDHQLMWTDSVEEVVISMPIKPEVLRSLSVYTDGENVTLTWQNDSARSRRRARARSRSHARAREPGLAPPPPLPLPPPPPRFPRRVGETSRLGARADRDSAL